MSRKDISPNALKVLYRLSDAGFSAHLVGGSVRDLLLGHKPKDFDIATDAHPEEIKRLFVNCRLIGRRFRLAHIFFGREIVEVATFRSDLEHISSTGMILRDNLYGTIEEDAMRRDFTVNALYYNIKDFSVIDYCNGLADLQQRQMRIIGDPEQRYREDPVRMLRAIRLAAKLDFQIEAKTALAITHCGDLLGQVAPARLFDEMLKLFLSGHALKTFELLQQYGLFHHLFAQTTASLEKATAPCVLRLIEINFKNTDERLQNQKHVTPAFLIASLLWYPLQDLIYHLQQIKQTSHFMVMESAIEKVLHNQNKQIAIPKRFTQVAREIWLLQLRLLKPHTKNVTILLENPRFRAAYDFLLLRAEAGEPVREMADWWTQYLQAETAQRTELLKQLTPPPKRRKRKRRRTRNQE